MPTDAVAHAIDQSTGALTFLNRRVCGRGPCHCQVDATGCFLLATNITDGEVVVFPIFGDGSLGAPAERQAIPAGDGTASNAHSAVLAPENDYVAVSDLALGKVRVSPGSIRVLLDTDKSRIAIIGVPERPLIKQTLAGVPVLIRRGHWKAGRRGKHGGFARTP